VTNPPPYAEVCVVRGAWVISVRKLPSWDIQVLQQVLAAIV